jgi:hypothetical protein
MEAPSSDEDDIDDTVPLSATLALASSSRAIPSLVARPKPPATSVAKQTGTPKPKPTIQKKEIKRPKEKAAPAPVAKPSVKPTSKPKKSTSSDVDSSESSEEDDCSDSMVSDEDEGTSSEEDDQSDDEHTRATTGVVPVGLLLPSTTKTALQRLRDAIDRFDPRSAPLGLQDHTTAMKRGFDDSLVMRASSETTTRLSNTDTCALLETVARAAEKLTAIAASKHDVDTEIECFRRISIQMHTVWESTLPQIEILDEAVRVNQESAMRASRAASELMGGHVALVGAVASSLEALKKNGRP